MARRHTCIAEETPARTFPTSGLERRSVAPGPVLAPAGPLSPSGLAAGPSTSAPLQRATAGTSPMKVLGGRFSTNA